MEKGKTQTDTCPYCDQPSVKPKGFQNTCSICGMVIGEEKPHIMFVNIEGIYHYCSVRCMELHEESLMQNEGGETA